MDHKTHWSALLFPLSSSIYSFIHFCTARPESPTIISVETTDREALVTWTFNDDGGLELKALILQYRKSSQKDWDEIQIKPPNKNKYTIMYLDPDTNYNFRILATNSLGTSTPSSTYFANTKKKGKKTPSSKKNRPISNLRQLWNCCDQPGQWSIHILHSFLYRIHISLSHDVTAAILITTTVDWRLNQPGFDSSSSRHESVEVFRFSFFHQKKYSKLKLHLENIEGRATLGMYKTQPLKIPFSNLTLQGGLLYRLCFSVNSVNFEFVLIHLLRILIFFFSSRIQQWGADQ